MKINENDKSNSLANNRRLKKNEKRQAQLARQQATAIEERRKSAPDGKLFEFKTVSVNAKGKIIHRETKQARSKTEDLRQMGHVRHGFTYSATTDGFS